MAEQKIELPGGKGKKKRYHPSFARGAATAKLDYKSAVVGLENATFDVGSWSDLAKFSKSLRNIKIIYTDDLQGTQRHSEDHPADEEN